MIEKDNARNIVITGFMGTGKTTTAARVAALLGLSWVDMDAEIVRRAGKPIRQIFAEDGEAVFRALEKALCRTLAAQSGQVIATGGGALVDAENCAIMSASGMVVCLDASAEAIEERLRLTDERPLAANWRSLLEQRRAAYAAIPIHVDTTGKTPDEVAGEIVKLWQRRLP